MTATTERPRSRLGIKLSPITIWTEADTLRAAAWFILGIAARIPLVARVEGVLDHDQSIVGLMALDIAAGRRMPIFFDGQRYMGAIEGYVAASFVALFGHSPTIVALSPLLFFGLFAAGQYALWRAWSDRATGHLAALISVLGAPMLALWSIVPRGGYIEFLAWALPVLFVYRHVVRPGDRKLSPWQQAGWGFLLAFGYFVNPLSLIVYVTLALDWTFARHGADLRGTRRLEGGWIESRWVSLIWAAIGIAFVFALAVCCHVEFGRGGKSPFVFLLGRVPGNTGKALGALGIAVLVGAAAWWSGAAQRIFRTLPVHSSFTIGTVIALLPFALHNVCVRLGTLPAAQSLPIWIRAPWDIGVNLRDGFAALGPLVGCDPKGAASVLVGQGVELPEVVWPRVVQGLEWATPVVVTLAAVLIGCVAWNDRKAWRTIATLRSREPAPPTVLALLCLGVAATLYILQATSPNSSSIRYLVPMWIVLPGLLASALRALPQPRRVVVALMLLVPWGITQVNLWREIDRPSPLRPLADELHRRGVRGIVSETPVALMVANLTQGQVGALEYHSRWPRLGDRYLHRFVPGQPVTCVVDRVLVWYPGDDPSGNRLENIGPALEKLAKREPGKVRLAWSIGHFDVWEVDLPLSELLPNEGSPLPERHGSDKLTVAVPSTR